MHGWVGQQGVAREALREGLSGEAERCPFPIMRAKVSRATPVESARTESRARAGGAKGWPDRV